VEQALCRALGVSDFGPSPSSASVFKHAVFCTALPLRLISCGYSPTRPEIPIVSSMAFLAVLPSQRFRVSAISALTLFFASCYMYLIAVIFTLLLLFTAGKCLELAKLFPSSPTSSASSSPKSSRKKPFSASASTPANSHNLPHSSGRRLDHKSASPDKNARPANPRR